MWPEGCFWRPAAVRRSSPSSARSDVSDAPPPPPPQLWQPDPSLLGQLGAYEHLEEFQIRWPTGFETVPPPPLPPGLINVPIQISRSFRAGALRPDGVRPSLIVGIFRIPANGGTAEERLNKEIETFSDQVRAGNALGPDFQRAGLEKGQINGLDFVRIGWQGTKTPEGVKLHGSIYICTIPNTTLALGWTDSEAHYEQSQALWNAAIMTFRRK